MEEWIVENAPFAYVKIKKSSGTDLLFVECNQSFHTLTGLSSAQVKGQSASHVFSLLTSENDKLEKSLLQNIVCKKKSKLTFKAAGIGKWIRIEVNEAEPDAYHSFWHDATRQYLLNEEIKNLQSINSSRPDYRELTSSVQKLAGARYAALNVYFNPDRNYTTVALSGLTSKEREFFVRTGFNPEGKKWEPDLNREALIKEKKTSIIRDFKQLSGNRLPGIIVSFLLKQLNIRYTVIIKVLHEDELLADFTLFYSNEPDHDDLHEAEIYADAVAMFFKRIEAEQKSSENLHKLQSLFEQTNDAVFLVNLQGALIITNTRAAEMLGYDSEEILSKSVSDLSVEEEQSRNIMKRLLAGERVDPYERWFRKKSGEVFPVEINAQLISDAQGNPLYMQSVVRDITRRKQAEEALMIRDALLRKLSAQVPGVIYQFRYHPDGRHYFPYASDNIYQVFEVTPDQVKTDATLIFQRFHPDDQRSVSDSILHSYRTLEPWDFECRVILPRRGLVWLHGRANPEKLDDESVLWHGYITDISTRKANEQQLSALKEQLELAVEGSSDGIWDWNLETNHLFLSRRWKEMLGYENDELENHFDTFQKLIYKDDVRRVSSFISDYLEGKEEKYQIDFRMVHKSGQIVWVSARGAALRNTDGKPWRMAGSHTDITARKMVEEQTLQQKVLIESLLDSIPDMVSYRDGRGRYLGCNTPFEKFAGRTRDLILGKTHYDLFEFSVAENLDESDRRARLMASVWRHEDKLLFPDGSEGVFETISAPYKAPGGIVSGVLSISRDITYRSIAEEKIRKLSAAVQQSPVSIVITDTEGLIEYVNPRFTKATGYSYQEALGQNPRILKSGYFSTEYYREMWQTLSAGNEWRGEMHNKRKNGELFWESVSISPIKDSQGNNTHYVAIKEDITHQKENQQALEESENLQRLLMENISVGVMMINPQTRIIEKINTFAAGMIGLPSDEIIGNICHQFVCPAHKEACPICDLKQTVDRSDKLLIKADGSQIPILKTVKKFNLRDTEMLLESFVDISEKVHAEKQIRESQELLQSVLQVQQDMICRFLPDATVSFANDAFARFFSSTPQKMRGQNLGSILPEYQARQMNKTMEKLANSASNSHSYEYRVKGPEGYFRWYHWTDYAIKDSSGEIVAYQTVGTEITDRKERERIEKEMEIAKNSVRFKQNFLSSLSHEIRTPLNGISGSLHLLRQTQPQSAQSELITMLQSSTEGLTNIIDQVLDYSRMESGNMQLNMSNNTLQDIPPAIQSFFSSICTKPIEFSFSMQPNLPGELIFDQEKLFKAIKQLITNAVKYTYQGEIKLSVTLIQSSSVTRKNAVALRVEVSDTGIGIQKEKLKNIFAPFSQVHDIENEKYQGIGLGLATCYEIARLHGGNMGISSEPGKGTQVWFTIEAILPGKKEEYDYSDEFPVGLKVLLIDDKITSQKLIRLMLSSTGCKISVSSTVAEAITNYDINTFDVALLDIQQAPVDGIPSAIKLRNAATKAPLIIAIGNLIKENVSDNNQQTGVDEMLGKPFELEKFKKVVMKHMA